MANLGDVTGSTGKTFIDSMTRAGQEEAHNFTLSNRCRVTIQLVTPLDNLNLNLLSSTGQLIRKSTLPGRNRENITVVLEAGTYQVTVSIGVSYGWVRHLPYRLRFITPLTSEAPTLNWSGEQEPTPTIPGGNDTLPNQDTLPGDTLLGDTLPGDTLPGDTLSGDTLSGSNYQWGNVKIGGGGFVSGLTVNQDQIYVWTDVGGSYKLENTTQRWHPLNEQFTKEQQNYYGGVGVITDPTNPQIVYMACGKYSAWDKGTILKSTNGGATWSKLPIDLKMDSNYEERWAGHRLAIDPSNTQRVLFGSGHDGIWLSTNGGQSWSQASLTASLIPKIGVLGVKFHPPGNEKAYAICYGDGVYESLNGGLNWSKLTGSPTQGQQMAFSGDDLIITHKAGVSKFSNGSWSNINPVVGHFNAIAVSPNDPNVMITCKGQSVDSRVYITTNKGLSWQQKTYDIIDTIPWWDESMAYIWTSTLAFDYVVPNKVWKSNGFGVYYTNNIMANPVQWVSHSQGIEEIVSFDLACPQGVLVSSVADVGAFYHDQGITQYPSSIAMGMFEDHQGRHVLDTDYCWGQPNQMVSIGGQFWNTSNYRVAKSTDGGQTWTRVATWNSVEMPIRVCMSSTDPNLFLVMINRGRTLRTTNGGQTWAETFLPHTSQGGPWNWNSFLVSDKEQGSVFYYYQDGKLYKSTDGGMIWNIINETLPTSPWDLKLLKTPPVSGEIYFSLNNSGLHYSQDGGLSFTKLININQAHLYCFGPAIQVNQPYTIYLYGKVNSTPGLFKSPDKGLTWELISDPSIPIGNEPNCMEADWQNPGGVFIGTNGRGIYYGRPI